VEACGGGGSGGATGTSNGVCRSVRTLMGRAKYLPKNTSRAEKKIIINVYAEKKLKVI
jgi:hypothetical protein